jgi:polysaccharide biosynthesis transport protein
VYLIEVLRVLRRRWLTALAVLAVVLAAAAAAIAAQEPRYESSATMGLVPARVGGKTPDITALGQVAVSAPLFTEAARSQVVREEAKDRLGPGRSLGSMRVSSSREAPIVFKIVVSAPDARSARVGAAAYANALISYADQGAVLPTGLVTLKLLVPPELPSAPSGPRAPFTLTAAAIVGLIFGVAAAMLRETAARAPLRVPNEWDRRPTVMERKGAD